MFLINAIKPNKEMKLKFVYTRLFRRGKLEEYKIKPVLVIHQKGMHLNHNFYVVVNIKCRTENAAMGHQRNI